MCRMRAAEMGECLGLHLAIKAAVRVSGSLETYSSRGASLRQRHGDMLDNLHLRRARGDRDGGRAPVTAAIAWMVPSTAVQRRASHKLDRVGGLYGCGRHLQRVVFQHVQVS